MNLTREATILDVIIVSIACAVIVAIVVQIL
jgi:hypothetical protein